jgi:hypothetical protein
MHPADQLLVFIKGGVLKSQATGRSTTRATKKVER